MGAGRAALHIVLPPRRGTGCLFTDSGRGRPL